VHEDGPGFLLVNVDLSSKPRWYCRDVNPRGLVPALRDDDGVTVESAAIVEKLMPGRAGGRGELDAAVKEGDALIGAGLDLLSGRGRAWAIGSGQTQQQRAAFAAAAAAISRRLQASGGPFLLGDELSVPDVLPWPFLRRFSPAAPEFCGVHVQGAPAGWLGAMRRRTSAALAAPNDELFLAALRRHRSFDFFDCESFKACECRPQLEALAAA
jgi:glutathione S-transferase